MFGRFAPVSAARTGFSFVFDASDGPRNCLRGCCSKRSSNYVLGQRALKKKPQGVERQTEERSPCQLILDCFDRQYTKELGDFWPSARRVLLEPKSWQYGVMLNRFTSLEDIKDVLQSKGFSSFLPPQATDVPAVPCPGSTAGWAHKRPPKSDEDSEIQSGSRELPSETLSLSHPPPTALQCYIHPSALRFPSQDHWPGRLKQYYLLNAASLLPVLALQVRDGEKVLDLCSAPGGKALAIMQTATPAALCCNEPDPHRRAWLTRTLDSFLPQSLSDRVVICDQDGRHFGLREPRTYDKVLADVPCSNDRSWLYSSSSQQGERRLSERTRLPGLQAQLLRSALAAVRPGGAVVYSTCTLSSAENSAVVEAVLHTFPDAEPEDLWEDLAKPLSDHFAVVRDVAVAAASYRHKPGLLVVPQPGRTWGPMFLCRIRRKG